LRQTQDDNDPAQHRKGIRLRADSPDLNHPVQLRILGDDTRGYLLAGIPEAELNDNEFWFSILDDALAAAERLGVSRDRWRDITDVRQVRTA